MIQKILFYDLNFQREIRNHRNVYLCNLKSRLQENSFFNIYFDFRNLVNFNSLVVWVFKFMMFSCHIYFRRELYIHDYYRKERSPISKLSCIIFP